MKKLKEMYENLNARLFSVLQNEKGQTMIEYALVAVLIAIVLVYFFKGAGVDSGIAGAGSRVAANLNAP